MDYSFASRGSTPDSQVGELKITAKCVADNETLKEHIWSALDRGLPEFAPAQAVTAKEVVIVCSGPSIKSQIKKIKKLARKGHFIMAVKGGHDFLLEHGITPHVAIAVDPREYITKYFSQKKKGIKYLIASQCHPAMFDFLSEQDVVLWHLLCGSCKTALEERNVKRIMVGGGSTSGGRALVLAHMMGFRKCHIFGMDSCLRSRSGKVIRSLDEFVESDAILKVNGDLVKDSDSMTNAELVKSNKVVNLEVGGKAYVCDLQMAAQVDEFQKILPMLSGFTVKSYGDGIITRIIDERRSQGCGQCRLHNEPWETKHDLPSYAQIP